MESKKLKLTKKRDRSTPINTENKLVVAGRKESGGMGKVDEEEWEIQGSNYGMNKSGG